jgi:hypothetical protein
MKIINRCSNIWTTRLVFDSGHSLKLNQSESRNKSLTKTTINDKNYQRIIRDKINSTNSIEEVLSNIDSFNSYSQASHNQIAVTRIANLVKGWPKHKKKKIFEDNIFKKLLKSIYSTQKTLSPAQLVCVLYAFSTLNVCNSKLIRELSELAIRMVPRFDGYQIATILYSHAVLKVKSDELINKIQIHFLSSPKAFYLKPQELSMIIWSIARLKNESYQINLSLLLLICKRLIHTMSDINISSVLWGITVLKLYDNVLIDSICKILKTEMKSNVWALSRLMHIEQDLLSKSNILINRNSSYEDFIFQLFSIFNHLSVLGIIPSNETIA